MSFLPAVSTDAIKAMGREIRSWQLARRSDKSLDDLARMFNSIVQGWINYYGRFYRSQLLYFLRRLNLHLVRWAPGSTNGSSAVSAAPRHGWPRSLADLPACSRTGVSAHVLTAGRWEPDEPRGSAVLREPGGAIPPGYSPAGDVPVEGAGGGRVGAVDRAAGRTRVAPETGQDPDRAADRTGEGVDFLGFHHRLVRSRAVPGRAGVTFLARWPARKAMQHARDRIRFMTMRARLAAQVEQVVQRSTCSCAAGRAISATETPPTPSIRSDATR